MTTRRTWTAVWAQLDAVKKEAADLGEKLAALGWSLEHTDSHLWRAKNELGQVLECATSRGLIRLARRKPSERQMRVLRALRALTKTQHRPPTYRELGAELGIRSTKGVSDHLMLLERRGLIVRTARVARGTRLTPAGRRALREVPDASSVASDNGNEGGVAHA